MDPFLDNADQILEAAVGAARANHPAAGWTILLGGQCRLEMLAAGDWDLEALRRERGAAMAFRVREERGRIRVEGRAPTRACRLERETPAAVARGLLHSRAAAHSLVSYVLALPALTAPVPAPAAPTAPPA